MLRLRETEHGRRSGFMRIAAGLAAAAGVGLTALFFDSRSAIETAEYATDVGQSRRVVLEDGSEVELNTASRLAVTFDNEHRSVELAAGEAFFNVEKDRERPFIVSTPTATIAVTGTSFSVSSEEARSIVHVLTGVVDVTPQNGVQATLLAGDMIEIDAAGAAGGVHRFDASLAFAWRNGKARFREEPLANVVRSLNRYFETPIVIEDETLADLPVTGEFDITDRDTAVRALEIAFDLEGGDEPARTVLRRSAEP